RRRYCRVYQWRRVLLGRADGGRPAWLHPGGAPLLLLRRLFRGRNDRGRGQGLSTGTTLTVVRGRLLTLGMLAPALAFVLGVIAYPLAPSLWFALACVPLGGAR